MLSPIALGFLAVFAFAAWKRWHRWTHPKPIDVTDLGGAVAGTVAAAAAIAVAVEASPAGDVPWFGVLATGAALLGAGLASVSLRLTRFARSERGLTYVADPRFGIPTAAVLVVVLGLKVGQVVSAVLAGSGSAGWLEAILASVDPVTTTLLAATTSYLGLYEVAVFRRAWAEGERRSLLGLGSSPRNSQRSAP